MTPPVGSRGSPIFPRQAHLLGVCCPCCGGDVICSPIARMDRGSKHGWGTSDSRLYGQMSLGDFTHRNGEMAFIFIAFHKSGRAVVELANTLRNEHGGKIAIANFLNSGIEDRMLGSQGSAS